MVVSHLFLFRGIILEKNHNAVIKFPAFFVFVILITEKTAIEALEVWYEKDFDR